MPDASVSANCRMRLTGVRQVEAALGEVKAQVRQVLRKLTRNSEAQASIESGQYTIQYVSLSLRRCSPLLLRPLLGNVLTQAPPP